MKSKQLASLVVGLVGVALVALLVSLLVERPERAGEGNVKTKVIPGFPLNDVSAIAISAKGASLNLTRKDGVWGVKERNGYHADFTKIGTLLRDVYDLGIVQRVLVGPSKFGRVGLLDPTTNKEAKDEEKPVVLAFCNDKGDEVANLWVGKEYKKEEQSQFGTYDQTAGRYVKTPKGDDVYLVAQQFESAKTDPASWLDKGFFQVNKVKSIERAGSPEQSWKLVRDSDTADFKLPDAKPGEELDKDKVSSMKNAFSSPSFEDVMVGEGVQKPSKITFKVETFEGFRYEVKLGDKDASNDFLLTVDVSADLPKQRVAPAKESDEDKKANDKKFEDEQKKLKQKLEKEKALKGFVYKVHGWVIDSINKDRKEIMVEKKKDEPKNEEPKKDGASIPGLDSSVPGLAPK